MKKSKLNIFVFFLLFVQFVPISGGYKNCIILCWYVVSASHLQTFRFVLHILCNKVIFITHMITKLISSTYIWLNHIYCLYTHLNFCQLLKYNILLHFLMAGWAGGDKGLVGCMIGIQWFIVMVNYLPIYLCLCKLS